MLVYKFVEALQTPEVAVLLRANLKLQHPKES